MGRLGGGSTWSSPPVPTRQNARLSRQSIGWSLALFVLAAAAACMSFGYGVVESISFEPTDASNFRVWVTTGFREAGGGGLVLCVVALGVWLATRRHHPLVAVGVCIAAVAAVTVMVLAAWAGDVSGEHPISKERQIAASVPLPATWGPGREVVVRYGNAAIYGPPRVDRIADVRVRVLIRRAM